ncbi:hypothetical protein BpHYR1_007710 [Brachionus plicatilis]|uniref:Uncharacterized protein n=1 Tax=Brachionus plicatilis TaxID=10195 RepID=A0A3M7PXC9_BRAPC|nr:hypothetical protein BpHYR1_007710 [Brachionus plicatilis]
MSPREKNVASTNGDFNLCVNEYQAKEHTSSSSNRRPLISQKKTGVLKVCNLTMKNYSDVRLMTSSGLIKRTFSYAGYIKRPHRSRMTFSLIIKSRLKCTQFLAHNSKGIKKILRNSHLKLLDLLFEDFSSKILSIKLNYGKNDQFYVFSLYNPPNKKNVFQSVKMAEILYI